jgi:hypothetical protein
VWEWRSARPLRLRDRSRGFSRAPGIGRKVVIPSPERSEWARDLVSWRTKFLEGDLRLTVDMRFLEGDLRLTVDMRFLEGI